MDDMSGSELPEVLARAERIPDVLSISGRVIRRDKQDDWLGAGCSLVAGVDSQLEGWN